MSSVPNSTAETAVACDAGAIRVGGLTPLSSTDYPGYLAAVVFCQGCPWRCGYCHNPHLVPGAKDASIAWDEVLAFLHKRQGLLDAVVFSGGEPTAQPHLADAMRAVKALGYRIGLHTAGVYPARLAEVLPLVDWVGMDVKAPFADYERITGVANSGDKAQQSLRAILDSGVEYEFRTTVHSAQLGAECVKKISTELLDRGANHYVLQEFRSQGCADSILAAQPGPHILAEDFCADISRRFETFQVRRA
jgi:pyruvate formate lyase activating enzyme